MGMSPHVTTTRSPAGRPLPPKPLHSTAPPPGPSQPWPRSHRVSLSTPSGFNLSLSFTGQEAVTTALCPTHFLPKTPGPPNIRPGLTAHLCLSPRACVHLRGDSSLSPGDGAQLALWVGDLWLPPFLPSYRQTTLPPPERGRYVISSPI